jgi:hypothetical protein
MNLRPSNLEQAGRPTAIAHDTAVPNRDIPAQTVDRQTVVRRRYSKLSVIALLVGGALTVFWGGLLVWLLFKAVALAI